MKRFIPNSAELAIFVTMAVLCAAGVGHLKASSHDLGLSVLACPIFVVGAVLGLRRSPLWTSQAESESDTEGDEADLA